jgi:hypothetical protein
MIDHLVIFGATGDLTARYLPPPVTGKTVTGKTAAGKTGKEKAGG